MPRLIDEGQLRAIQEVRVELERQEDALLAWALAQDGLFVEFDEEVQKAASEVLARFDRLIDANSGRSGADPFVIALAQVKNCAVVTEERARSAINPRIPDVCAGYGIPCFNIVHVIRTEGWVYR